MLNPSALPQPPGTPWTAVVLGLEALLALCASLTAAFAAPKALFFVAPVTIFVLCATVLYLRRTTAALVHDYLELERTVKTYELVKLLDGEPLPEDRLAQVFPQQLPDDYALVLLAVVEGDEDADASLFYREDRYLRGVFKPVLDQCGVSYFVPRADCLCIVVCLPDLDGAAPDEAAKAAVAQLCDRTADCITQVREETGLLLGAVVTTVYHGPSQMAAAYRDALELTSYAELLGDTATVKNAYAHLDAPEGLEARKQRMDLEKQYLAAVSARDYGKAGQLLDRLLDAELPMAVRYPEMLKNRLVMRIEQLLNALCISLDDYDSAALEVVQRFRAMMDAATVDALRQQAAAVIAAVADYADHTAASSSGKVPQVLDFIHRHYADPNLGAQLLSEQLGLSTSYLSRLVKQATGVGIVDCIHAERLKAAKALLTGTDLSVDEIAEQVGFSNRWTFTRSFKRYEGTTPGAYRESQDI
jgi:AraC-like DNA-binding protein